MQFRLRTLLVVFVAAAVLSLIVRHRIANRHMAFHNYSIKSLNEHLDDGRTVLVSVGADWSQNSKFNRNMISNEMGYSLRKEHVVALDADWTRPTIDVQALMEELGIQKLPVVAVFSPGKRDSPILLTEIVDKESVLQAIQQSISTPGRVAD